MAEEELVVTSSEATTDASHKRKLDDLELESATTETETESKHGEAEAEAEADQSDAKRPRFESNGDNAADADADAGQASQNGHQDEVKEDDEQRQEELMQPEQPADTEGVAADAEELPKEPTEIVSEEPVSNENEKPDEEKVEEEAQPKEEAAAEANDEVPREGDVPIPSSEQHTGSGAQMLSRKMEVPNDKVGVLIGKAGDTIRSLQDNSGAKIQIMRDADADPRAATRPLEIVGTLESINKAEKLIKDVIAEADAGGSPSLVARGFSTVQAASGGEQLEMEVPFEKVGLIIGKGGETIRNLQTRSGARIQLMPPNPSDGDQSRERIVRVTGSRKQIETAREMIRDAMNQTVRPSPLSGGYNQPAYRPRGPAGPQWGPRGPHSQFSAYDYPHRGPYPSQGSQYPPPTYGNYPPHQAPRSNFGPSWEHRPPPSMHGPPQGSYYGQPQGPDYGHPPPYSQTPAQPYGHGYGEVKYDHHAPPHHFGPQPTPYGQGSAHSGYGPPQDQYGKPPIYGMQPQAPHTQSYGQPRPSQPGEVPYQGAPISSSQGYGQNVPPQQSYPYGSNAPMQQNYPPYGSAPSTDGYVHPPPTTATAPGYSQGGQPPATAPGYGQPAAQAPSAYPQPGATGGYSSYPTPQPTAYAEQPAVNNAAYGGYQGQPADPAAAYGGTQGPAATYPAAAAAAGQSGYAQPSQTQPTYDQSSGYGNVPAGPTAYGKSVSPQPAAYPQYDASQMYGAHR